MIRFFSFVPFRSVSRTWCLLGFVTGFLRCWNPKCFPSLLCNGHFLYCFHVLYGIIVACIWEMTQWCWFDCFALFCLLWCQHIQTSNVASLFHCIRVFQEIIDEYCILSIFSGCQLCGDRWSDHQCLLRRWSVRLCLLLQFLCRFMIQCESHFCFPGWFRNSVRFKKVRSC